MLAQLFNWQRSRHMSSLSRDGFLHASAFPFFMILRVLCVSGLFGRFWGTLGRSWTLLGRSWALLGRLWPLLGRSWGALGASWDSLGALLGASWRVLEASWEKYPTKSKKSVCDTLFEAILAYQMEAKIIENRIRKAIRFSYRNLINCC